MAPGNCGRLRSGEFKPSHQCPRCQNLRCWPPAWRKKKSGWRRASGDQDRPGTWWAIAHEVRNRQIPRHPRQEGRVRQRRDLRASERFQQIPIIFLWYLVARTDRIIGSPTTTASDAFGPQGEGTVSAIMAVYTADMLPTSGSPALATLFDHKSEPPAHQGSDTPDKNYSA